MTDVMIDVMIDVPSEDLHLKLHRKPPVYHLQSSWPPELKKANKKHVFCQETLR